MNNEANSNITYSLSREAGEDVKDLGYTITPSGNVSQGNYSVTYVTGTFTINPKSLGTNSDYGSSITVSDIQDITYDGQVHTPEPVVEYGDKTLVKDTDYTLSYKKIDNSDNSKNVGTYVITITGKGNYSGSITKEFKIVKKVVDVEWSQNTWLYDGDEHSVQANITNKIDGDQFNITYENNSIKDYVEGGKTVTITSLGNDNYALPCPTPSVNISITKREVLLTSSDANKVYDGEELIKHTVTITNDGFVEGEGVTYSNFASITNVGEIDNTFDYTLNGNTKAINYNINKSYGKLLVSKTANAWVIEPSVTDHVYGTNDNTNKGNSKFGVVNVTYVGKDGTEYNSTQAPINVGSYTAKFKVEGNADFGPLEKDIDFKVLKKSLIINGGITVDDREYNGTNVVDVSQIHYDYSSTNFLGTEFNDQVTYTVNIGTYDDVNVNIDQDTKEILDRNVNIVSFVLDEPFINNYEVNKENSVNSVTSKILKANVEVKADNKTKEFDDLDEELTYSYTKVNDEELIVNISREEGELPGVYEIKLSQTPNTYPNYNLALVNGTYTIVKGKYKGDTSLYASLKLGNDSIYDLNNITKVVGDKTIKLPEDYEASIVSIKDVDNLFKEAPVLEDNKLSFGFKNVELIGDNHVASVDFKISSRDIEDFVLTLNIVVLKNLDYSAFIEEGWTVKGDAVLVPGLITTITVTNGDEEKSYEVYTLPEIIYKDSKLDDISVVTDEEYTLTVDDKAIVHCTGELDALIKVLVDDEEIDHTDETICKVEEGSTIITFTKGYMDKMSIGIHKVELVYPAGSAYCTILVKELPPVHHHSSSDEVETLKPAKKPIKVEEEVATTENDDIPEAVIVPENNINDVMDNEIVGTWALLNLVLAIISLVVGIIALFKKKKRLISLIGLLSVIVFILTENIKNNMILIDRYTIVMLIILVIELFLLLKKKKEEDEEETVETD